MFALFKKEFGGFMNSLTGFIVLAIFILANALFLWVFSAGYNIIDNGYATIDSLFSIAPIAFLFLIPAITMRVFAEEKKSGAIELLLTKPLTELQVVMGKYLAALALVVVALIPTFVWVISVYFMGLPVGNIDLGGTWGSYIGLLFVGALFVAVGLWSSSITDNQAAAFLIAVFLCGFLYIGFDFVAPFFGSATLFVQLLGANAHYLSLSRGVVDSRDIIYFLGCIVLFVFLTRLSLESKKNIYRIVVIVMTIIVLSILSSWFFFRIDLTAEKRHSITPVTKSLLSEIDEPLRVTVYLKGDFPPGFTRLSNETREFLDVLCAYNRNISYEFINPNAFSDASKRDTLIAGLMRKGLNPTTLNVNKDGRTEQQLIFPCALVTYKDREVTIDLLKSQIGVPPEEVLNNSIEALEFNMAIALRKLTTNRKPAVAFLEGQREADLIRVADAVRSLREYYSVYKVRPDGNPDNFFLIRTDPKTGKQLIEPKFRALIIAKPDSLFSEADKFLIDQYIMYGGKVLWFIDPVSVSMDSIRDKGRTVAYNRNLNLDDQLFRYGVRINDNLVMDLNALSIPVVTGQMGGQPQQSMLPWYFFPVLMPKQNHPIIKNINAIKTEFVSSMDTVKVAGVQKTILLTTSKYSRLVSLPVDLSLDMLRIQPDQASFNTPPQTVAVLLEGQFTSLYRNRIPPLLKDGAKFTALNQSRSTGMLVVSDGDVVMNQVQSSNGRPVPLPLGYDRYSNQLFGNSDLLLNTVNYLCDDAGLVTLRSREVILRLLDRENIKAHKLAIQVSNVIIPVLIIIIIGFVLFWIRRRKYAFIKTHNV